VKYQRVIITDYAALTGNWQSWRERQPISDDKGRGEATPDNNLSYDVFAALRSNPSFKYLNIIVACIHFSAPGICSTISTLFASIYLHINNDAALRKNDYPDSFFF